MLFLFLHLGSISNHLDISSVHKARKFYISTSFTTQWKPFIYFILFFWSVHHCKFLSWKNVFLSMQSEILFHKARTCSYPWGGDSIGSEVKFRFFCGWFCEVTLQNDITQSSQEIGQRHSRRIDWEAGPFSLDWRSNWRDHCLHSTDLRFRGCLSNFTTWQSVHEGCLFPTHLSFTTSPKKVIRKLMSFQWLILGVITFCGLI